MGAGVDAVAAIAVCLLWRRRSDDLARLAAWYVWLGCAFAASGYFHYAVAGVLATLAFSAILGPTIQVS